MADSAPNNNNNLKRMSSESQSEPFIAMYVFTYKESVTAGGATIDNNVDNNQHSARIKDINIKCTDGQVSEL